MQRALDRAARRLTDMTTVVVLWIVLGIATMGLALYRKLLTLREQDTIVVEEWRAKEVEAQVALANKLDEIDKWGKLLTLVTVLVGIGIGAMYLYSGWANSVQP
jgi:hypothetical protein